MKNHITNLKEWANVMICWDNESLFIEDRLLLESLKAFTGQTELSAIISLYGGLRIGEMLSKVVTESWHDIKDLHEKSGFAVCTWSRLDFEHQNSENEIGCTESQIDLAMNIARNSNQIIDMDLVIYSLEQACQAKQKI